MLFSPLFEMRIEMSFIVFLFLIAISLTAADFYADVRAGVFIAPDERMRVESLVSVPIGNRYKTYPAIESHGSIYLPHGNVIINTGDLVFASGMKLTDMIQYTIDIGLRLCGLSQPCPIATMILNITSCACECRHGYTGIDCDTPDCNGNGNWTLDGCACVFPYTSDSMCSITDCGLGGMWNGTQCICWPPYTGQTCSVLSSSINTGPPASCMVGGVFVCSDVNNHGAAVCSNTSGICMCPPAYGPRLDRVIQRSYRCSGNLSTCIAVFYSLAPVCCLGLLGCNQKYGAARIQPKCQDQVCCQSFLARYQCEFAGCIWGPYYTCMVSQLPAITSGIWLEETIDCIATPDNLLCDQTAQLMQMDLMRSVGGSMSALFVAVQRRAWRTISTYSQWDDGVAHSIVMSIPGQVSLRLVANWESPMWSTLSWVPAIVPSAPQSRSFQFELIEVSATLPSYRLGSAYRIWVWGTTVCLLDYSLGQDQLAYFGAASPVNGSLMLVDIWNPSLDISKEDCGVFYIDDASITTYHIPALFLGGVTSSAALVSVLPFGVIVTTPSVFQDSNAALVYSLDPVAIRACRYIYCKSDLVVGTCSTSACAVLVVDDDALWARCKPCIAAHVPFSVM